MGMLFIGGTDADSIPVSGLELTPESAPTDAPGDLLAQQGQRLAGVSGTGSGLGTNYPCYLALTCRT